MLSHSETRLNGLLASVALWAGGCSSTAASVTADGGSTIVVPMGTKHDSPTRIELGNMDASRRIERSVLFENRSRECVTIARIKTDCECVRLEANSSRFEPNAKARGVLVVDLTGDPEFKGSLGVPVTGFDEFGREVFDAVVCTRVAEN
jgi:hypothetical protein